MKITIALLIILYCTPFLYGQGTERAMLSGTKLSIIKSNSLLIPKHTSTIFVDSTYEFAFTEFPNIGVIEQNFDSTTIALNRDRIIDEFDIEVDGNTGKVFIMQINYSERIFQCYFGDSTYGVLSQCVYRNTMSEMKGRLIEIIESVKFHEDAVMDWENYLSFTYDKSNSMKLVDNKYLVKIMFTPKGIRNDSLFTSTNIACLQFPPAPSVKSSEDLMLVIINNQLSDITINEVLYDGDITINQQQAYKFSALCERNGVTFELCAFTFYNSKSALFFSCNIIDDSFHDEVYDFISSIVMKKDGY